MAYGLKGLKQGIEILGGVADLLHYRDNCALMLVLREKERKIVLTNATLRYDPLRREVLSPMVDNEGQRTTSLYEELATIQKYQTSQDINITGSWLNKETIKKLESIKKEIGNRGLGLILQEIAYKNYHQFKKPMNRKSIRI